MLEMGWFGEAESETALMMAAREGEKETESGGWKQPSLPLLAGQ